MEFTKKKVLVSSVIFLIGIIFLTSCQPPEIATAKKAIKENNPEVAERKLREAVEKYPDNPEVHYLLARNVYAPEGKLDSAQIELNKAKKLDPKYKALADKLEKRIWANYQNKAVENFNKAQEAIFPETKDSLLNVASGWFKKAIAINDTSKNTYIGAVQCFYQKGDTAKVHKYAQQAMDKGVFAEKILSAYTATFANPNKALQEIDRILAEHDYFQLKVQKVNYLIKQKKYDQALSLCNELLEEKPKATNLKFLRAQIYMDTDKVTKATQEYHELLEENPKSTAVLIRIANAYFNEKKYDQAKKYAQQYVDLMEEKGKTQGLGIGYEILWKAMFNLGEKQKAIQIRKKAQQYK